MQAESDVTLRLISFASALLATSHHVTKQQLSAGTIFETRKKELATQLNITKIKIEPDEFISCVKNNH